MISPYSRPNLFVHATRELSQDAIICWLVEWSATPSNDACERPLRSLGRAFVEALLGQHNTALQGEVQNAEIYRQDRGIDVLTRIKDDRGSHVLLIEDKTNTGEYCNQLLRYREAVRHGKTKLGSVPEHWPIYLKTGNQSLASDREVEEAGFKVFNRGDFLAILNGYQGTNAIASDFREYLQRREDDFVGLRTWRREDDRKQWSWGAWEGFYRRLEFELDSEDRHFMGWHYVHNKAGGFLAFFWYPVDAARETVFYIQLEVVPVDPGKQKLCFKVQVGKDDTDKYARDFYKQLREGSNGKLVERPQRFGRRGSQTMTIGWWKGEWLAFGADGMVDFSQTAENLRQASRIVRAMHDG